MMPHDPHSESNVRKYTTQNTHSAGDLDPAWFGDWFNSLSEGLTYASIDFYPRV
jgi:hypothetical protein